MKILLIIFSHSVVASVDAYTEVQTKKSIQIHDIHQIAGHK